MNFSKLVKSKFNAIISQMCSERSRFVKNPLSDFTRDRKLSMSDTIKCIINMVSGNLNSELLRYFHFDVRTPSSSAFIQQRAKIRAEAFSYLLYEMNAAFPPRKTGKYTFLACDGTLVSIPLPQNSNEQYAVHRKRKETREYYQIHLHTLFDLNSQRYLDLLQEPVNGIHEQLALKEILLRGKFDSNTIIIMDRGYEGHDLFAWMNSLGLKFVCRAKDGKCGGIVKGFHLSMDGEFDDSFDRIYTIKNTKEVNSHPEIYYKVHQSRKSTFFVKDHPDYRMTLRVVRVRLENEYECLITNLTPDEFSMSELKDIYWMRWGIETSFRQLKYTIGLVDFHSKKRNS